MKPYFIQGKRGKIFSILFSPASPQKPDGSDKSTDARFDHKAVLFFAPFAEEMNKSRHMMARLARELQLLGIPSLVIDPFGTGDSEGRFGEASFADWCDDYITAAGYLQQQGITDIVIVGIRFGALFAAYLANQLSLNISGWIFWQPVLKGEMMITQFLRMKVASDMISGGKKITTRDLRDRIIRGDFVEVAGYELTSSLIQPVDDLSLDTLLDLSNDNAIKADVAWYDIVSDVNRGISPVNDRFITRLREKGFTVDSAAIQGESFWNTPELATVPELVSLSSQKISTMLS